jgi:hypothetical protein
LNPPVIENAQVAFDHSAGDAYPMRLRPSKLALACPRR